MTTNDYGGWWGWRIWRRVISKIRWLIGWRKLGRRKSAGTLYVLEETDDDDNDDILPDFTTWVFLRSSYCLHTLPVND